MVLWNENSLSEFKNLWISKFFILPHLLNQSPTLLEDKLKLIPNKIIVTGNCKIKQSFIKRSM